MTVLSKAHIGSAQAKVYLGSTLIADVGAGAWTPAELTPLVWFDFSDETTITESSGLVSAVTNKGSGADLAQGTASNQPTTGTTTLNSLNALDFDGSTDRLVYSGNFTGPTAYQIAVFNPDGDTGYTVAGGDTASRDRKALDGLSKFTQFRAVALSNASASLPSVAGGAMFSINADATLNTYDIRLNGDFAVQDTSSFTFNTSNWDFVGYGAESLNGQVSEIIALDAKATQADYEKCEGYLAHKYALVGSLPVGHTYKDAPPTL